MAVPIETWHQIRLDGSTRLVEARRQANGDWTVEFFADGVIDLGDGRQLVLKGPITGRAEQIGIRGKTSHRSRP